MTGYRAPVPSPEYLSDIRLRIRKSSQKLDEELSDLIRAAREDLVNLAGILPERAEDEDDPSIKLAVATFVKAEFGLENADAERYREAYGQLKIKLLLSDHYTKGD